jgi:hypothetical protein
MLVKGFSARRFAVAVLGGTALAAAALAMVATAAPSVTGSKTVTPGAIDCGGQTTVTVELAGTSTIVGTPQDVMLVLDRSGSMGGQRLTDLQAAANGLIDRLDEETDGVLDGKIGNGSQVGVVSFAGTATVDAELAATTASAKSAVAALTASGGTNHGAAINLAQAQFAGSNDRAMVIVTDGGTTTGPDPAAAATAAKNAGTTIFTVGLGISGSSAAWVALQSWASPGQAYLAPDAGGLDAIFDAIGAAITGPAATDVRVTEQLGPFFGLTGSPAASKGTVTPALDGRSLTWTIDELGSETATLTYTVTHDETADPVGGTTSVSSTSATSDQGAIAVDGGEAVVTVECEGELVVDETCQPGEACGADGVDIGGIEYSIDAGEADATTQLRVVSGVSVPAGVCSGAVPFGDWALWDIRPLTDGGVVITGTIDRETLKRSGKKWFEVRGCWGTNETFPLEGGGNAPLVDGAYWGTPKTFKNRATCSVTTVIDGVTVPTVCSTVKNVNGGARLTTFFPYIGDGRYDPRGGIY